MRTHLVFPLLIASLFTTTALAHHGWSSYDANQTLTLTGVIEASGYEHPHGFIKLKTRDKLWHAVLAPPSRMESRGLANDMLKPGTQATAVGYPHRSEAGELRVEHITLGGKTIDLR